MLRLLREYAQLVVGLGLIGLVALGADVTGVDAVSP